MPIDPIANGSSSSQLEDVSVCVLLEGMDNTPWQEGQRTCLPARRGGAAKADPHWQWTRIGSVDGSGFDADGI